MTEAEFITGDSRPECLLVNPGCPPGDRDLRIDCTVPRPLEAGHLHPMYCPQCDSFHRLAIPPHGVELPPSPLHLWE